MDDPEVSIERVTPDQARAWLEDNVDNRTVSQVYLAKLREEVKATGWRLVPDALAYDVEGHLLNGQHRMMLLAEQDKAQKFIVIRGLPVEVWDSTDRGKQRSLSDTLKRRGETNVNALAAAARLLYVYERAGTMVISGGQQAYAHGGVQSAILQFLEERPGLRNSCARRHTTTKRPAYFTASVASVFDYTMRRGASLEDADTFMGLLTEPVGLTARSPILALRKRLDANAQARASNTRAGRVNETEKRALAILAFNKWILGEEITLLSWKAGGASRQAFPLVHGYAEWLEGPMTDA
jgi:hypothetical protein